MGTSTISIAASGDDGTIEAWGAAYPAATQDPPNSSGTDIGLRRSRPGFGGGFNYVTSLAFLRFDTSVIPDSRTITSAYLRLKIADKIGDVDNRSLAFQYYDWGASLDSGDFAGATPTSDAHAGTDITGMSIGSTYDLALLTPNASLSRTAYTHFRGFIDGGEPTGENSISFYTFDHSTEPAPILVVTTQDASAITPDYSRFPKAILRRT
jgi:hypothetical protein